ncbi:MAG: threonine-phosphate decarboxylase, partial [Candidatus Nealsonbacteria bacterium]|nr:threonine-phosphate decarboxylase [Candidatus Nealsonbacteria bacterium]
NELKKIKYLKPLPSSANFVFCKSEISADKLADYLYYNHNILIRSSLNQSFLKSDRYVRIAVRKKEDNDKLINALINAGKLLK